MSEPRTHGHPDEDMITVESALQEILSCFHVLDPEIKPTWEALGQTLSGEVESFYDIPPLTNSAMDGYAVRHADISGAKADDPQELEIIDQVPAGSLPRYSVTPGTATRIMTGAPIPNGADTVVPFENTDEVERRAAGQDLNRIRILSNPPRGSNIRPAGQDIARGQLVLEDGVVLRPSEIGVLASIGYQTVNVIRRPRIAVLATGDELVPPGEPLTPGKIYDSNSIALATAIQHYGGQPRMLGIATDNIQDLTKKIESGFDTDMLITSAGVSRGDYDMVKDVLKDHGTLNFWSVKMRPAKPLAFGVLETPDGRSVPHIGLPGNPVSALVAFEQFCRPAILKMLGRKHLAKTQIEAVLRDPIVNEDGRRVYARTVITKENGTYYARLTGPQGSNILTSLAVANGLAICPEDVKRLDPGELVQVQMLDWPEGVGSIEQ